ncbi:MAG: glycoside-pentoside-hexuronide (GPH):cation symporter [Firmicutes bacterium]|nr:glycoside-pentoside-hexuronide (GPH):cation symporter [Bacillota bacterium]
MEEEKKSKSLIGFKDKLGYAFGDMGLQFTFVLLGPYLTMFFTDVLGLPLASITTMMLVTRLFSAFSDPIGASLMDRVKPGKTGRFRRWLVIFCVPAAAAVVMMFTNPGLGAKGNLVWVYAASIVYAVFFTGVNIPFGSLASVITPLENERSSLSVFRSLGSSVGSMPGLMLLPLFIFTENAAGVKFLDERKLLTAVAIFALCSVGALSASFAMTKERVTPPAGSKPNVGKTLLALLKNRPFLVLCLASVMHMSVVNYTQTMTGYVFKDYFQEPGMFTFYSIFNYAPMAILMLFIGKLVNRFGKKEVCSAALVLSVLSYAALFLLKTANPWLYLALVFLNGLGLSCFTLQLWAIVTDVIDYQGLLSGQSDEGTTFGFFFFARKLGFMAADAGAPQALKVIGYREAMDGVAFVQTREVAKKMYNATTGLPAAALLAMFLLMAFAYPLGRKQLKEMHGRMEERKVEEAGA